MWKYETLHPDLKLGVRGPSLYKKRSRFQNIQIIKNPSLGNVLFLDGVIQTTENDEFIYHEMLTHPAMMLHPRPEKVLIVGGGDGGILREVLKYKTVKEAWLVEIDKTVIETAKKYLKKICRNCFEDNRTRILIADGARFVKETKEKFDIVIVDSPDPIGVAKTLFSQTFYRAIYSILNKDGMMARQTGSTLFYSNELQSNLKTLRKVFANVWVHLAAIPTYLGGFFSLAVASKKTNLSEIDIDLLEKKCKIHQLKTHYYNPYLHIGSALLPEYVRRKA